MKYNININQLALFETAFDLKDCAILDYLDSFCNSKNPEIEKQRVEIDDISYTWIDYGNLLRNMPLLRIKSKGALTPRIKVLEKEGFIKTKILNGDKLYVSTTALVHNIYFTVHARERRRSQTKTLPSIPVNATVHTGEPIIEKDNDENIMKKAWSLEEKLQDMEKPDNPNKMLNIIATFIRERPHLQMQINEAPEPSKRLSAIINAHIQWAKKIVEGSFTDKEIFAAIDRLKKKEVKERQKSEIVVEWVVSTIYKELTK
jgi:hypothetical protein